MFGKLKSRKFWATFVGGVIVLFGNQLGLDPDAVQWFAGLVMTYVVGQGIADHGQAAS